MSNKLMVVPIPNSDLKRIVSDVSEGEFSVQSILVIDPSKAKLLLEVLNKYDDGNDTHGAVITKDRGYVSVAYAGEVFIITVFDVSGRKTTTNYLYVLKKGKDALKGILSEIN